MKTKDTKGHPTPVRLTEVDEAFLSEAAKATGMTSSEILRRSLRLLRRRSQETQGFEFIISLAA